MTFNQSWIYQGRQSHGWFGHGTSPQEAPPASDEADPLFQPSNAGQRADYAAHAIIAHVPRDQRSRWSAASSEAVREKLQTAIGAWYAASNLDRDTFRERFLDPYTSDETVDRLRAAARGIIEAQDPRELGAAAADLADAAQNVGAYQWQRFVGDAAQKAETAVSHGEVPRATLVQAAGVEALVPGAIALAEDGTVALLGRIALSLAVPEVGAVLGAAAFVTWLKNHSAAQTVPVHGFGPDDRGVAPISVEINGRTRTALVYHGPTTQTPDTETQHTLKLSIGADGLLRDKSGQAVARLSSAGEVVALPGMDIPDLLHGPTATPPSGILGESIFADEARRALDRPPPPSPTPALPNSTASPAPAPTPGTTVLPGREVTPQTADIMTMAIPTPRDGVVGGKPTGTPESVPSRSEKQNQDGIRLQNKLAILFAALGFRVEFNVKPTIEDGVGTDTRADWRMGGNIFDAYAPLTNSVSQIRGNISKKVSRRQAFHIILDLERTNVTREDIVKYLDKNRIKNLKELFICDKNGDVYRVFPNPERITLPQE